MHGFVLLSDHLSEGTELVQKAQIIFGAATWLMKSRLVFLFTLSSECKLKLAENNISFSHIHPASLVNENVWNSYLVCFSRHNDLHSLTALVLQVNALVIVSIFLANLWHRFNYGNDQQLTNLILVGWGNFFILITMDFLAMISLLFKEIQPYGNNQLAEFIYFILP